MTVSDLAAWPGVRFTLPFAVVSKCTVTLSPSGAADSDSVTSESYPAVIGAIAPTIGSSSRRSLR